MSRTLIKRLRWLFFYGSIKLLALAGVVASLFLIGLALYGLFISVQEYLKVAIVLLIPSVFMLAYSIKLFRLSKLTSTEVDKWFSGACQK